MHNLRSALRLPVAIRTNSVCKNHICAPFCSSRFFSSIRMDSLAEVSGNGAFVRSASLFRSTIPSADFPAVPGRYSLFVSYACPWASRCLAARTLKGLEDIIDVAVVHPTWQKTKPNDPQDTHWGWAFRDAGDAPVGSRAGYGSFPCDETCSRPRNKSFETIRDVYESQIGAKCTKFTVPILYDNETGTIVNNESEDIVRILNAAFNDCGAKHPEVDLYPASHSDRIDELNQWIYTGINDGVYCCGFAKSQEAYDAAFAALNSALDRAEGILSNQRYLCGDNLTEADIRLFVTLIRFDPVYVVYFKCNGRRIEDYPHLSRYVADIYNHPGIASTVSLDHIVTHYYTSHPTLNPYAIIPGGSRVLPSYVSMKNQKR